MAMRLTPDPDFDGIRVVFFDVTYILLFMIEVMVIVFIETIIKNRTEISHSTARSFSDVKVGVIFSAIG